MRLIQRVLLICCGALLTAAKPKSPVTDMDLALQAGGEFEARGAYEAARTQLQALSQEIPKAAAEELQLRICAVWQRQHELEPARRCYLALASHLDNVEYQATARYRAAALAVDMGLTDIGRDELTQVVDDLPSTDGAQRSLILARALHRDDGGVTREIDFLLGVASRLPVAAPPPGTRGRATPRAPALLSEAWVEIARLRLLERHDPEGALRMLARAQNVAQENVWQDEVWIWQARALRALGRYDDAIASYQTLIEAQTTSWFVGDYHSEFYDDALYEIGQTLEQAGRPGAASVAYAEVLRQTPMSRLVDDAAFRMATLKSQTLHSSEPLNDFARAHPESSWVRAVRQSKAPK